MTDNFLKILEYLRFIKQDVDDLKIEEKQDEQDEEALFKIANELSSRVEKLERLILRIARKL